ncbi:MAG: domain containing protein [Myxococcales bacterium]|nr:domain containing protein [Myxococcales bacterium]
MLRRALAALSLLALGACTSRTIQYSDGGLDAGSSDGPANDAPGPLALDVSVTGCAHYDVGVALCSGTSPLTLAFAPVGSPTLTRFVWSFGDGTPNSTDRTPSHTYALPGLYDVAVVADGPAGSVSRTRLKLVEVTASSAGGACDVDAQCGGGMRCLCTNGSCGPAFSRGLCTGPCSAVSCGVNAVCAAFVLPTPPAPVPVPDAGATSPVDAALDASAVDARAVDAPYVDAASDASGADAAVDASADVAPVDAVRDGGEAEVDAPVDAPSSETMSETMSDAMAEVAPAASETSCLGTCKGDPDCAPGFGCRSVVSAAAGATRVWVSACLPAALHEIGAPCRDQNGALADGACASGLCADLGALGACSAACGGSSPCPTGSTCATFGNGRSLCVAACGSGVACARDPLLACEPAGASGALGFQASPFVTGATYCAPSTCTAAADCAPAGVCTPLGAGGHCTRP